MEEIITTALICLLAFANTIFPYSLKIFGINNHYYTITKCDAFIIRFLIMFCFSLYERYMDSEEEDGKIMVITDYKGEVVYYFTIE